MSGAALCRLPDQACETCGRFCPDEELEPVESGCHVLLYCGSCLDRKAERNHEAMCEDFYGA